jgi:hypothetical protein
MNTESRGPARRWLPYVAGALLGAISALSVAGVRHPVGAATAFEQLAGFVARRFTPTSPYLRFVVPPEIGWQVWEVVGVFVGAFAAAVARREFRWRTVPEEGRVATYGRAISRRWIIAFVGGALVQFGAGIAGGCTSGLAVSGGIVFAPAAFVFMLGMFAGGIPVAELVHRFRRRGEGSP